MKPGTAANKLRKKILFALARECNYDICYRCRDIIKSEEELSIEHKEAWLYSENPKEKFFDLSNVAFSHLKCNISAKRNRPRITDHGSASMYKQGCRCDDCRQWRKDKYKREKAGRE